MAHRPVRTTLATYALIAGSVLGVVAVSLASGVGPDWETVPRCASAADTSDCSWPALEHAPATPADTLPPCAEESDTGCYWDASERGNGVGADVVSP